MPDRYYVAASGSGWSVKDNALPIARPTGHIEGQTIKVFWERDYGGHSDPGSWARAHRAALEHCANLNEAAPPWPGDA